MGSAASHRAHVGRTHKRNVGGAARWSVVYCDLQRHGFAEYALELDQTHLQRAASRVETGVCFTGERSRGKQSCITSYAAVASTRLRSFVDQLWTEQSRYEPLARHCRLGWWLPLRGGDSG